ncbi:F0F1 ATP synthase subunit B family protein [Streptomyces sp. NPDC002004]
MNLVPERIGPLTLNLGPLNPRVEDLGVAVVAFVPLFLVVVRMLRRIDRVLAERSDRIEGAAERAEAVRARAEAERVGAEEVLAEARHDAARIRQQAHEEGVALILAAREDGLREREQLIARGQARIAAERAAAEAALRPAVPELASDLVARILGEPVPASAFAER